MTENISTIGELIEALVKHIELHPDCHDDPVVVHNVQSGISHPIVSVGSGGLFDDEDPGLMLFVNDNYVQVHESFRTIPDKHNIAHRINMLFQELVEEFKKPRNENLTFKILPGSEPPRVVFRKKDAA